MYDPSPLPHAPEAEAPRPPPPDGPDVAALRADVVERLRPVCRAMTPEQFDALVRDVVAFKLRWRRE